MHIIRMTPNVAAFDAWIRGRFVDLNTELEERYFALPDRADIGAVGASEKAALHEEGRGFIAALLAEGNTDEGFDSGFDLLGNVGLYMAACGRHEITLHTRDRMSPLKEASALAMQLGASLGVTPRFATSHLTTHNHAHHGAYKRFTHLADEALFTEDNTRAVLAYKRAADALFRLLPLGVSHPVAADLLATARDALADVGRHNAHLFAHLDPDRFFYNVRPYFKPHHVGLHVYRGANAGDFAGINMIDLLLGLCQADNASYSQILVDKFLYMMPEDQLLLRDCMRRPSLLNGFLTLADTDWAQSPIYQANLRTFLEVCALHGRTAAQHHDQLVARYIVQPAGQMVVPKHDNLTASGPPLPVLIAGLEKLRDLRLAANRDDIPSRYADLQRLRATLREPA